MTIKPQTDASHPIRVSRLWGIFVFKGMATSEAVMVDGDYFVRLFRRKVDPTKIMSGAELAKLMWRYWILHADPLRDEQIYRIFFYDSPPLEDRFAHPVTNQNIDFSKTPQAFF